MKYTFPISFKIFQIYDDVVYLIEDYVKPIVDQVEYKIITLTEDWNLKYHTYVWIEHIIEQ